MKTRIYILSVFCLIFIGFACSNQNDNVSQKYNEAFRSQVHFTPDSMWMNDPNGMVYYEGEYHLFYQYFPDSNVWGPMHWGHAVSKDLLHWKHLPIALAPDFNGWIFSGSAVVDWNNSTGFGENGIKPLVAIFTQHLQREHDFVQQQSIAYSIDKGLTWKMHINNPVIENPGIVDFRDPKVFWHSESSQWIMSLVAGDHAQFYGSKNLKEWKLLSTFGQANGSHAGVWECPDLIELPINNNGLKKWALLVSINPGGLHGGSATQYFIGDFDGTTFTSETPKDTVLWLDYGADNYAGVTWSNFKDEKERPAFIGWMSNWQYATITPTERWRSAMTLPRYLSLFKNGDLYNIQSEVLNTNAIKGATIYENKQLNIRGEEQVFINQQEGVYCVEFTYVHEKNPLTLTFANALGKQTHMNIEPSKKQIQFDRVASGIVNFKNEFAAIHTSPFNLKTNVYSVKIVIDKASIELFINDGQWVATEQIFPQGGITSLAIKGEGITLNNVLISALQSIW